MKYLIALAVLASATASVSESAVQAMQADETPMFRSIRAMGGSNRNYFVTDIFWGDYTNNLQYKNRFASWVNANYGSMGGQYASYCWYGDDENAAYEKRDRVVHEKRSSGNNVILTNWGA
ncbi:hypothetical protein GGC65_001289 [Sphingopyxis sp. OAS728]|uniref:hypothetical protein n=1 Tax=Sphingopyxis sp. OAS728 TaxID=2663823 RepID=UPI001788EF0E|nr:hypothetical protein [Sphingopyxis sp. OAS728]MBE1526833.1 hypothetical protein [Sphingopyxis sp. OAS728]